MWGQGTDEGSKLAFNDLIWNIGNLVNNIEFGFSGFNAIPGGYRKASNGSYDNLGYDCYFWSNTDYNDSNVWYRRLYYNSPKVARYNISKFYGFSVRCLKD